jgi:tRNA nucleotidyltransferase (CCA-adding enzyme)
MVRACRYTALEENWHLNPTTSTWIQYHAQGIYTVSKERIRDEILKALGYQKPSNFFRSLHTGGLLPDILPDLARGVGCEQNHFHGEDVWNHLLRSCDFSVSLTDNVLLRLATLTHDIAKPHTKSVDADNKVHFFKHEIVGASLMYEWMREYKFPNKDIEYVTKCVRFHQWRFEKNTKDQTIRRWLQAVGKDIWRDLIILRCADRKGNLKRAHKAMITRPMQELIDRAENIIATKQPIFKEDLAIDGNDLNDLGITPGKIYKDIFQSILSLVINEPHRNTKEELVKFVRKNYVNKIAESTN